MTVLSGNQVLAPKVDIGLRYGNLKADSVAISVRTWVGPDDVVPNNDSVNVVVPGNPGSPFTITLSEVGTDHPDATGSNDLLDRVGYTGFVTVTGLAAFPTKTDFYVEQGVLRTDGSFICAPQSGDHFALPFGGCDSFNAAWRGISASVVVEPQATGMWKHIVDDAQNPNTLPIPAVKLSDDINGYPDWGWCDDRATEGTGRVNTPAVLGSGTGQNNSAGYAYDYVLWEFLMCGMGGVDGTIDNPDTGVNGQFTPCWWGRNVSRLWGQHNLGLLPQFGDHEMNNDQCFLVDTGRTSVVADSLGVTGVERWAQGITNCYMPLFGPLQGDSLQSADTAANHWGTTLGDIFIVSPDYYYNAVPTSVSASTLQAMPTVLGMDQVNDLKDALINSTAPWTICASTIGFRSVAGIGSDPPKDMGVNWPFYDLQTTEFDALFTNGFWPDLFITGDFHHMWAGKTGNTTFIYGGTINGSQNVGFTAPAAPTLGMTTLYDATAWMDTLDAKADMGFGYIRVEMKDTMTAFVVNGKYDNNFNIDIHRVFSGDNTMGKQIDVVAGEGVSTSHTLVGTENVPMQLPAGLSVAKPLTDMQKLFADIAKQVPVIPGSLSARTEVIQAGYAITTTAFSELTIPIDMSSFKHGLSHYRVTVNITRTTTTEVLGCYLTYGGGGTRFLAGIEEPIAGGTDFVLNFDIMVRGTSMVAIACHSLPASTGLYSDYGQRDLASIDFSASPVNINIYWGTVANPDSVELSSYKVEHIAPVPRQVIANPESIPSLKTAFFPSDLATSQVWSGWPAGSREITLVAPKFLSVRGGTSIVFNGLSTSDGAAVTWPTPSGSKVMMLVGVFDGQDNIPNFSIGDAIAGEIIPLSVSAVNARNNSVAANYAVATITGNPRLIAQVLAPTGSGAVNKRVIIDETDTPVETLATVNTTFPSLVAFPALCGANFGDAGVTGIYLFEFDAGLPSDYLAALLYMAQHPDIGPYPGWHAVA